MDINIDEEPKWYVLHTLSGYENMVKDSLEKVAEKNGLQDTIVDIQIPMEDCVEEKNGKKKVFQRKMFPCYVLVKMKYRDSLWHTIVNTRGVTCFVGPQGRPLPLTDAEIGKMKLEKVRVDIKVSVGDKIKVTAGPLSGFAGDVTQVDDVNQKCKVNVIMFGRMTPVELEFTQIETI
ncbi:MAG: transcription termination/antitermination protein NusG [Clostridia bacterium]